MRYKNKMLLGIIIIILAIIAKIYGFILLILWPIKLILSLILGNNLFASQSMQFFEIALTLAIIIKGITYITQAFKQKS